ncbi:HlyU family transcriptional regulator [Microvirga antarctica]|uniref:HlyU family transcriptional regulator n=1 Tax=Microvirga antarctica TaxID=2819233 RepID=UPI001B303BC1|nr:HlyU family transcriptional regulator [Microvirga antarctica]
MATVLERLWSSLFGGPKAESARPVAEATEYKGYLITPTPYPAKGQFQTAGLIERDLETGRKEHRFVRAETHASVEDASSFALAKGRQIIDEQGDRIFD